jgi:hypothetical protein
VSHWCPAHPELVKWPPLASHLQKSKVLGSYGSGFEFSTIKLYGLKKFSVL